MNTLVHHLSQACDAIDAAYHCAKPRTWSSRYPRDRASPGADVKWIGYESAKSAWVDANPLHTPAEYQQAMTRLAQECGV